MRHLLLCALLVLIGAEASAGACRTIRWRSLRNIQCIKAEGQATLIYNAEWVWKEVKDRGRHREMLLSLCIDPDINHIREIILKKGGEVAWTTPCEAPTPVKEKKHESSSLAYR